MVKYFKTIHIGLLLIGLYKISLNENDADSLVAK